MGGILVYSDKDNFALELLTAARNIGGVTGAEVKAITINDNDAAQVLAGAGADIYQINNDSIVPADVAAVAAALGHAAGQLDTDTILLSSDRRGKELAGRLAQVMGAGCLTDVSAITVNDDRIECQRNALGGATVATQYITADKKVIAVRSRTFDIATGGEGKISTLEVEARPSQIKVKEVKPRSGDTVDIEAAEVLVAVGQGLNSREDLAAVEKLAQAIGGEVACSKPVATDKKWLSEERIIGLSGKKCKPELAVILGISGQVQFTVGIRDARIIVAVNTDENAAMNQMADYIMQADLHAVVDEMNKALG